jgi:membrane protease YdiL (CAAX protease family)
LWYAGVFGVTGIPLYGSAFILFAFFALAYIKSGNIIGLVLLHGLNNATLSVRHFFGSQIVGAVWLGVTLVGVLCLGYLVYGYLREKSEL